MSDVDFGAVVPRAVTGERGALDLLARACVRLALRVARAHRLTDADAWDVGQDTWIALAARLGTVREPSRLPGWLITTARRRVLRMLAGRRREVLGVLPDRPDEAPTPEARLLDAERSRVFWGVAGRLPARYHRLLRLLADRPELTHAQLAAELGIAVGSVGPLRRRCFDQMRRLLTAEGFRP
ncbi:RNA polymerase sigma factor [Amycolatopsis sp. 195334CR]|uniref:RNA polymerase sigma factor n=1 Tax=Amycolatopsis sp. 195334CR TaxID=2814588 RepID=UPI001A8D35FE|nr:sigma-70 family RNA polymerase sigma factor [Amycolatopsis sp. 195334CR]MBN6033822.1 sigma-70 family RNA polymerase sigma factor [Amycolatopsis sp. 195334CR]